MKEPFYITEVDQTHNPYCGCYECVGREPDSVFELQLPMDKFMPVVIGKCGNCSYPIIKGEGTHGVHYGCWEAYRAYLNGDNNLG